MNDVTKRDKWMTRQNQHITHVRVNSKSAKITAIKFSGRFLKVSIYFLQSNRILRMKVSLILSLLVSSASAFVPSNTAKPTFTTSALSAVNNDVSRSDFMKAAGAVLAGVATTSSVSLPSAFADDEVVLPSGVKYTVVKAGNGPKPEVGELAAIRFAATCEPTGNKIDDIFDTPEPYYTRVGSGGMIKGVEEVIPMMRVGDRFYLTVPVSLKSHFFCSFTYSNNILTK